MSTLMWVGESWKEWTKWLSMLRRQREERSGSQVLHIISFFLFLSHYTLRFCSACCRIDCRARRQHSDCEGEVWDDIKVFHCVWRWMIGSEARVPFSQRLAVVRRTGKHTSCFWLLGLKAGVTVAEEEEESCKSMLRRWIKSLKALRGKMDCWVFSDCNIYCKLPYFYKVGRLPACSQFKYSCCFLLIQYKKCRNAHIFVIAQSQLQSPSCLCGWLQ